MIFITAAIFAGSYIFYISKMELEASISERFMNVTKEKALHVEYMLKERVHEAKMLAAMPFIVDAARESNSDFSNFGAEAIQELISERDNKWIRDKKNNDLAIKTHDNKTSGLLQDLKKKNISRFGEIFFTNRWGAAVAMSKILSDYYQLLDA